MTCPASLFIFSVWKIATDKDKYLFSLNSFRFQCKTLPRRVHVSHVSAHRKDQCCQHNVLWKSKMDFGSKAKIQSNSTIRTCYSLFCRLLYSAPRLLPSGVERVNHVRLWTASSPLTPTTFMPLLHGSRHSLTLCSSSRSSAVPSSAFFCWWM